MTTLHLLLLKEPKKLDGLTKADLYDKVNETGGLSFLTFLESIGVTALM